MVNSRFSDTPLRSICIHSKPLFISSFQKKSKTRKPLIPLSFTTSWQNSLFAETVLLSFYSLSSHILVSLSPRLHPLLLQPFFDAGNLLTVLFVICVSLSLLFPLSAYILISLPPTALWSKTPSCVSFFLLTTAEAFVSDSRAELSERSPSEACILSLLITERRLLCRHWSGEKDVVGKQRMKRKFLEAETKESSSKGSFWVAL